MSLHFIHQRISRVTGVALSGTNPSQGHPDLLDVASLVDTHATRAHTEPVERGLLESDHFGLLSRTDTRLGSLWGRSDKEPASSGTVRTCLTGGCRHAAE